MISLPFQAAYLCIGHESDSVSDSHFSHGKSKFPRIDDAGFRCPQSSDYPGRKIGLKLAGLFPADQSETLAAVLRPLPIQNIQARLLRGIKSNYQRTGSPVFDVEFLAQLITAAHSLDIQLTHLGFGSRIETRVDDGGIGTGRAHGDVIFFFDQNNRQIKG